MHIYQQHAWQEQLQDSQEALQQAHAPAHPAPDNLQER